MKQKWGQWEWECKCRGSVGVPGYISSAPGHFQVLKILLCRLASGNPHWSRWQSHSERFHRPPNPHARVALCDVLWPGATSTVPKRKHRTTGTGYREQARRTEIITKLFRKRNNFYVIYLFFFRIISRNNEILQKPSNFSLN